MIKLYICSHKKIQIVIYLYISKKENSFILIRFYDKVYNKNSELLHRTCGKVPLTDNQVSDLSVKYDTGE